MASSNTELIYFRNWQPQNCCPSCRSCFPWCQ